MQKQNPLLRIWGWGKDEHGRLIGAVISALIAVLLGMLPYFAAAQVIIGMLAGEKSLSFYLPWLGLGLAGYAARTLLYNMALSMSHKATFSILKNIRQKILEKLPKLPPGTVMDMSSGKMKQIIVDQVDGLETTPAHLFPELTANIAGPLIAAMNFVDTLATVGTTVASVDELLSAEEQHHGDKEARIKSKDIELSHVSFGYHEEKNILRDVSLSIPAGRMTALVGPSGSGKSTIAKLIAGFWDVKDGTVSMGGVDEKKIPLEQLYDHVAFVSQDNYLFDESVRENIRQGRLSASDKEVEAAAKAAGCDAFIRSLEKGYETNVGGGGAHLSGGELQRIAIARAMLKDAPIVILDDATANVDPENKDRLQKAIEELTRDKTIIMIAHRLKTARNADQILVVDDGRIVQQGKHEDLIGQEGICADFVLGRKEAIGWKLNA